MSSAEPELGRGQPPSEGERVLNHRFVVVTGTSRGIGRATALRLSSAGRSVIAGVRRPEEGVRLEREAQGWLESTILDLPLTVENWRGRS